MKKLALFLGTLALALLVAEGALSLLAGLSLRSLAAPVRATPPSTPRPPVATPLAPTAPAEGAPPAVRDDTLQGIFHAHEDPRVGYTLEPDAEVAIYEGEVRTDHLGLRQRPGPPAPPDAKRLAVLGDSVAFGFGLDDDECLAARVEAALQAVRGPQADAVECRTVAAPSWNHRATVSFLLDHMDELAPDIVLYLPCRNDVCDIDGVHESGLRRVAPDPSSHDPWLSVSVTVNMEVIAKERIEQAGRVVPWREVGADALEADLAPESSRRYDANADSIVRLHDALARRGARLLILFLNVTDYNWHLARRLRERLPDLPCVNLVDAVPPGGTLGFDPHPNARSIDAFAVWVAEDLLGRGWIGRGAGASLPQVPPEYAERRKPMPPREQWDELAARARHSQLGLLQAEVDFTTGRGLRQVYGGLNRDTSARSRMLVLLKPAGEQVLVSLRPVEGRPDLYPLEVVVQADGAAIGSLVVPPDGPVEGTFALAPRPDRGRLLEIGLTPADFVLLPNSAGRPQIASFVPVRIASVP